MSAWPDRDAARVATYFSADAVYHNIPLHPVHGRPAIENALAAMMSISAEIDVDLLQVVSEGPVVMTERVDHIVINDRRVSLPVMGVFEVHDGLITAWRDYFDLAQFRAQLPDSD